MTTTTTTTKAAATKTTKTTKATGPKSSKQRAAGSKQALAMKKAGKGIFAPKQLSEALVAICGKKSLPRTEVTKSLWSYIKKNGLNKGRIITPDATLKKVCPVASFDMLKMATFVSKHLS